VKIDTLVLQMVLSWVTIRVCTRKQRARGGCIGMPFWLIAVLSAAGVLVIVWVLYLLDRRWM